MAGKQAKILTDAQISKAIQFLKKTRYPERDLVIFLLSVRAGLRAKEIADLTWDMVLNSEGHVDDFIHLEDKASKGNSGRVIPMHSDLVLALMQLEKEGDHVVVTEKGGKFKAGSLHKWFYLLYTELGFIGCTSHSGRRTFGTKGARKVKEAGGSLREVQELLGHKNLNTTQHYLHGDMEVKRKLISLM